MQYHYQHQQEIFHGYLADGSNGSQKARAVLVVHDWSGRNDFAIERAEWLSTQGFIAFAVDLYGEGRVGTSVTEKQALMQPLINDRSLLLARMQAALNVVRTLPNVDTDSISVMGFCFGGLCALDLARSGAKIYAAISFHGLLNAPNFTQQAIHAKILALHGYDDPMVTPQQVDAFCQEMTIAAADWQLHVYGGTKHAFTNPQANDQALGTVYNAQSAQRAWKNALDFLHLSANSYE